MVSYIVLGAIGFSAPASYLAGLLVIPTIGWRWMFVIPAVGATIIWYLRKDMPESPRWLEAVGRGAEAEQVLRAMEVSAAAVGPLPPAPAARPVSAAKVPISALFSRKVIRRTLLIILINIAIGAGSYGFSAFIPTFFVKQGLSVTKSLSFALTMSFGSTAATIFAWWLSDKVGRKWGIVLSTAIGAVSGLIYPNMTDPMALMAVGFILVMSMSFTMAMGITIYGPELFPTEYRLRGNGLGQVAGRMTSMLAPYATVPLFERFGVIGVTGGLAALFVITGAVVAVFGIETRRRSLEAIEPAEPAQAGPILASEVKPA
jgi:putative MFS transporter